ncbi:putative (+)-abscisic acid 8'-hydroxylase [Helianthus anomalus]
MINMGHGVVPYALETLFEIDHLMSRFELLYYLMDRWEVIGEDGVQYGPFPVPRDGLPIKVYSANK